MSRLCKKSMGVLCILTAFSGMEARSATSSNQQLPLEFKKAEVSALVADFKDGKFAERTGRALDSLIQSAVQRLAADGYADDSRELANEWSAYSMYFLNAVDVMDLGDHRPLNAWIAKTYRKLESKLGKKICHAMRWDDLIIFDYGIPVVFHPNGDPVTGEKWDSKEYGKHFVPFAAALTYWTVNLACSAALPPLPGLLCGIAAEAPRYAMAHWIAPKLSPCVYAHATGHAASTQDPELNLEEILSRQTP